MGTFTRDRPKTLLNLDGVTLLEKQLQSIRKCGVIDKVIYVLGYMADVFEEKLKILDCDSAITVFNPFYDVSNNLISLWFAKYYMDIDFAITNGDNLFQAEILRDLSFNRNGIYLTVHKKDKYDNDDMKVTLKDSRVHKVSKLIDEADAAFESVGLAMVSGKSYREKFKITIERMVRSKDYLDKYWLEVFNTLAREKVAIRPFQIEDGWQEFDYHHDVEEFLKYKGNGPGKTD